jgi:hypothetical protein
VSLILPESVTSLPEYAFQNCTSLESLSLPKNLVSIDNHCFTGATNISFSVSPGGSIAFFTAAGGKILLKTEGAAVTLVSYPSALGNVTLPDNITAIGPYAFYGCSGLSAIELPAGITNIGTYAFRGCLNLSAIDIPGSIKSIGSYVFANCYSLASVTIRAETPPTINSPFFENSLTGFKFYVPADKVGIYKSASGWITYYAGKIFAIPSDIENSE